MMPWRLYRYILGELLKQVLLTTMILVTIIAFGAVIKPLAGDTILTPAQAIKFVGLAMIPMLQYALPFAAGFAATLTLHRFVTENEILAMAASGMSYRSIFAPVIGLGLALMLIMVILTQTVIPRFFGLMAATLAGDVKQLIATSIDRGVPFEFNDLQIYAEDFEEIPDPPTGADERFLLRRVVASKLDPNGMSSSDVTAAGAVIDLYHRDRVSLLKLAMEDTVAWDARSNSLRGSPRIEPTHAIPIPRPDRSDPEHLTLLELRDARLHPERAILVEDARSNLLKTLNDYQVSIALNERLSAQGGVTIAKSGPISRRYDIDGDRMYEDSFLNQDGSPIVITELVDETPSRRFTSDSARLRRQEILGGESGFTLELSGVEVESLDVPLRPNQREKLVITGLDASGNVEELDQDMPLMDVLAYAEQARTQSGAVNGAVEYVEFRIRELMGQIDAQVVRRSTLSVTAFLLLTLGAILAVLLRNLPPLGVYIWAFFPALLDLILIASGNGMIRDGDLVSGTIVSWSGNGILLVMILFIYSRVTRN